MTAADPFHTARLRGAVLRAWDDLPARFREDANAEEMLSLGYGPRVVAELAANGADAARAAGHPGEIAIGVDGSALWVANTGAPLTADGVAALAALRASAKRGDNAVGHFGVGFTAVRALADEITVSSTTGGVRFSAAETRLAARNLGNPAIDAEIDRRNGLVPALRLPWSAPGLDERAAVAGLSVPLTTCVRVNLRDGDEAASLASSLTTELAEDLLWALPGLVAVVVPGWRVERIVPDEAEPLSAEQEGPVSAVSGTVVIRHSRVNHAARVDSTDATAVRDVLQEKHFHVHASGGALPAELLADRPVEERARRRWRLTWVLPADADADAGSDVPAHSVPVIGAPTPTEEPLDLPARLIGTLPVDETRTRIAPGPLTDYLVARAATAYVDLVQSLPAERRIRLIPGGGFPLGAVDAALRSAITERLARTAFLVSADGTPVTPGAAAGLPGLRGHGAALICQAMPGLIAWPDAPGDADLLRSLGIRALTISDITAALAQMNRPADYWRGVYDALVNVPVDELRDLPIPRLGGGLLIGPREVLLAPHHTSDDADSGASIDRLAQLVPGLRLAPPEVDHRLLRRLGVQPADIAAIVGSAALRDEIRRRWEDFDHGGGVGTGGVGDSDEFARAVLDMLRACGDSGTDDGSPRGSGGEQVGHAHLSDLILTDTDDEPWPAGQLFLPDSALMPLLADDVDVPIVGASWLRGYGSAVLESIGVRSGFAVGTHDAPPTDRADLDDVDEWWDEVGEPSGILGDALASDTPPTFLAVADLDLIADDRWPDALRLMLADPRVREALRPLRSHGRDHPSYTAWWMRRHARLDGQPLGGFRSAGAHDLAGLYDALPLDLPAELAHHIGVLRSLDDAAADPEGLLRRWADRSRPLEHYRVSPVTSTLIAALAALDHDVVDLPADVRTLDGSVAPADNACVLDRPDLAQLLPAARLVAAGGDPDLTADVLDLPLASERYSFELVESTTGPGIVTLGSLEAGARATTRCGRGDLADSPVLLDPDLAVRVAESGTAGSPARRVCWWITSDGRAADDIAIDGSAAGIGRAVAYLAGRWRDRHLLEAAARGDARDIAECGLEP